MLLLRVFSRQSYSGAWNSPTPELKTLLACFEFSQTENKLTASLFRVTNFSEELEVATALLQCSESSPEKRFGVCVDSLDCAEAGLELDERKKGETGIDCVDRRHIDVTGTRAQFEQLMKLTLGRIIAGNNCLRLYSAYGIAGQLAVFSSLRLGIEDEARNRCRICLGKSSEHFVVSTISSQIEISGHLHNSAIMEVVGRRSLMENSPTNETESVIPIPEKWWQKIWNRIARKIKRRT